MEHNGWIKIHRKIESNPVVYKDAIHLAVWVHLLLKATHNGVEVIFNGKRTKLNPGQLTIGRKVIAKRLKCSESKVQRVLKCFESEQQIEQRTDRQCRLITINNWNRYQESEQRFEQRVNNDRTTSEQRVNTKQECKNVKMKECKKNNIYKKNKYLDFILLTDDEYTKLQNLVGDELEGYLERLNNYIGSTGKKYKSHYFTLLNWARKDGVKSKPEHDDDFYKKEANELHWQEFMNKYGKDKAKKYCFSHLYQNK